VVKTLERWLKAASVDKMSVKNDDQNTAAAEHGVRVFMLTYADVLRYELK
jgi:hypothetical protein